MYIDIKQILHSLRINYTSIPPGNMITPPPFKKKNNFYRQKTMFLKMFEVDTNEIM